MTRSGPPFAFGTDGVRGVANAELTPEFILVLGRAAARVLGRERWVLGRDPRRSSPMLAAALAAGLASEGAEVADLGVVPTPVVAHAAAARSVPGAMISASHNPFGDNGVKLFARGGLKLTDEVEAQLEGTLEACADGTDGSHGMVADPARPVPQVPTGAGIGFVYLDPTALAAYQESVYETVEGRPLGGLRVVLDCANGSASSVAPEILRHLGAQVTTLAAEPDGCNINAGCGSTHPEALQEAVVARHADVGIAYDGDADRALAVDHTGALVDGDHILAICAVDLHRRGRLAGDTVVVTVMTNLGFRLAMEAAGLEVLETQVGDRSVLQALEANGLSLGGEQSGHIIFRDLATTGDGILTSVQLLDALVRAARPLAELASGAMTRLPQVLRNVRVHDRNGLATAASVWEAVHEIEAELGTRGRVLLRASGTEPVVRVMVEAPTPEQAGDRAERLCAAVTAALGTLPAQGE